MAESKQKVIERNRAPRVQIAYDVEHYGSPVLSLNKSLPLPSSA